MDPKNYVVRKAEFADKAKLLKLYHQVAASGSIALTEWEITESLIEGFIQKSFDTGIQLVLFAPNNPDELLAEIHCYKTGPEIFKHVLSNLTVVVHPAFQGSGLGRIVFGALLSEVEMNRSDILRVELLVRESNQRAITLYQKMGFKIEGKLEKRINAHGNTYEADIPMAWFNSAFQL